MKKKYKLTSNPRGIWKEDDKSIMKVGRIIAEDEVLNKNPFSLWYRNQERYWEEVFDEPEITGADRYNSNKPQISLLDFNALEDTVQVLAFGANKYARDNWKKGLQFSQVLDSMLRHIKALQAGQWIDPESNLPHIGHIGCNAMFLGSKTNTMDMETLKEEFELWQK